jgi:hypothetical protein
MPEHVEYATRQELNGIGSRVNSVERVQAGHTEALDRSKLDTRDLWDQLAKHREDAARIERESKERDVANERLVNQVSLKVAGISAIASIFTTIAVAVVVHIITKGAQ